ncbi:MAG: hypothetical protein IJS58_09690 [Bacilli bacterium]|jgi:hypothetical protein|nr:hypothetical protein [Bacilli bacterium]
MLLSLLTKEEKIYFIELVRKFISIDGEVTDVEKAIVTKLRLEMGEDLEKAKSLKLDKDKLIEFYIDKTPTVKRIVFMNLLSASLQDEWYNVEQHLFLSEVQEKFEITDKKKRELMKVVYSERDLREKAKRVVQE